jgi:thiol:disulfide interchange protein DsbD
VFPLIPVTMTVFAQQGEKRPLKVLPLAILYVLGLAASFTVLGILAALAGKSFGEVFRNPVGVLAVVIILAILMASAFGAFEIQLPSGAMGRLGARRGLLGALFMGIVMGAIAAPCVGPFILALITFVATTGSIALGAVSFFVTGLGLGLPYLFLGIFTGLVNRFPRGGGWLVWVKRLMGLALAGVVLWFIRPFFREDSGFFWPLVLAVFLFAALYLGVLEGWSRRPFSRRFWVVRILTGLVILAAGASLYAYVTAPRPQVEWQEWQPGALEAAQDEGKPVLLYFGADWCAECVSWHYKVFTDPEVVRASRALAHLHVDVTRLREGPKRDFAARFQAENPPVVIVFGRDGEIVGAYRNPPEAREFVKVLDAAARPPLPKSE